MRENTRYITLPEVHPRCVLLRCDKHKHSCSLQLFGGSGDDDFSISEGGCTSVRVMYLVFSRVPGEHYRRRLGSLLLCLCYVFRALN